MAELTTIVKAVLICWVVMSLIPSVWILVSLSVGVVYWGLGLSFLQFEGLVQLGLQFFHICMTFLDIHGWLWLHVAAGMVYNGH